MASKRDDGANDYYVGGEKRQGITFYILLVIVIVLIAVLAFEAHRNMPPVSPDTLWPAAYLGISLAIGAIVGIIAFNAFNNYRIIQHMLRNSIRVSPRAFPEIYEAVKLASERLSTEAPATYVTQSPAVNAYLVRLGLNKKVIMVNTALLKAMDPDELLFILGHEISHAKYGRWRRVPGTGIPYIVASQFNEYRCDRGGLIASRNVEAAKRALLKLVAGREFIDRIDVKSFEKEKTEAPSRTFQRLATHPMIDARIKELMRFSESPAYTRYQYMQ